MPIEKLSNEKKDNNKNTEKLENEKEPTWRTWGDGTIKQKTGEDKIKDIQKEEQKDTLEENISKSEGQELIIEKIKTWAITSWTFGEWYAQKTGAEKLSDQLQINLDTMFNDIQWKNWPQKMLMSKRGITTILQKVAQSEEAKKTIQ